MLSKMVLSEEGETERNRLFVCSFLNLLLLGPKYCRFHY